MKDATTTTALKHDALGTIRLVEASGVSFIERDTRTARRGLRWLSRHLARREATTLRILAATEGVPKLVGFDGQVVRRTFLSGSPLYETAALPHAYFANALRVLRTLHCAGIAHNDLAKEANWICGSDGRAGIVDFQLALASRRRGRLFRGLAYEDLRHWLKHKRTYEPNRLTARQRMMLATPTCGTRVWRSVWKPLYRAFTRRVLGWRDRTGPAERQT